MGTCQGQRDKDCSSSLRGLLPSRPREAARVTAGFGPTDLSRSCRLPIPVLRASGTPQRSEKRPGAERAPSPNDPLPKSASAAVNTAPLPRRRGASGAARRGAAGNLPKPLAGGRARATPPLGLHAPAGPGLPGRAAGGVAAGLPPPRPAPGLREPPASGAARRKSPPLLLLTRPSAAPRPHPRPRPRRLLRSLSVSEPALRPAAGVRQGRRQRQGRRLLLQRERGVTPAKTVRACWSDVLGRAPTPHEALWLVGSEVGRSFSRGPGAARGACWGRPGNTDGGRLGGPLSTGHACQALSPTLPPPPPFLFFTMQETVVL